MEKEEKICDFLNFLRLFQSHVVRRRRKFSSGCSSRTWFVGGENFPQVVPVARGSLEAKIFLRLFQSHVVRWMLAPRLVHLIKEEIGTEQAEADREAAFQKTEDRFSFLRNVFFDLLGDFDWSREPPASEGVLQEDAVQVGNDIRGEARPRVFGGVGRGREGFYL